MLNGSHHHGPMRARVRAYIGIIAQTSAGSSRRGGSSGKILRQRRIGGRVDPGALPQNGWAQYSTGRFLPCLTMISCGEVGADVSVASTGPATFDLANVAIDQTAAVATMSAMAAKMIILRMSCHPFQRGELTIALAHRAQLQGEGLHTVRFFAIAWTYRARRRHWDRVCKCAWIGSQR